MPLPSLNRLLATILCTTTALSAAPLPEPTPDTTGKRMLDAYFEREVIAIERFGSLAPISTREQWHLAAPRLRAELQEMLGLSPWPEKGDLRATRTGEIEVEGVRIEKLHFQSLPGLYVTANLYRPINLPGTPLPAVLYLCGHSKQEKDGIHFGNKTGYHHHGLWFARHGYVCLTLDTLQLGELPGKHHGTHRLGHFDWISRGYTPAGVEAWNGIRAVDYLITLPEVDSTRIGVTGRSGGGAYSWWVAALDERIAAAAPTAGITDLRNHILDGVIEGHCDCMFFVNTYRWDFDRVAALVAPRPLLISNTDKDRIFPLDGVHRLYQSTRRIYQLLDAEPAIGLHIAEGPHQDTQPLHTGAFQWMERHLKSTDPSTPVDTRAPKELDPSDLKVFTVGDPTDSRHNTIEHSFVPTASPPTPPSDAAHWEKMRDGWMQALKQKVFAAWPTDLPAVNPVKDSSTHNAGIRMTAYDFDTQPPFRQHLYVVHRDGLHASDLDLVVLNVLDDAGWDSMCSTYHSRFGKLLPVFPSVTPDEDAFAQEQAMFATQHWAMIFFAPRGIGDTEWLGSESALTQIQRRFYLLGQTVDSARVWDIRRAIQAIRQIPGMESLPLWLQSSRAMAVNTLYASLFEDSILRLDLHELPPSHTASTAPAYLNVLKHLDIAQALTLAAEKSHITVYAEPEAWAFPSQTVHALGSPFQFSLRHPGTP